MTVSGSAADFTEEVRTAYEENLADMLGCEPSKVSVTILSSSRRRALLRKLSVPSRPFVRRLDANTNGMSVLEINIMSSNATAAASYTSAVANQSVVELTATLSTGINYTLEILEVETPTVVTITLFAPSPPPPSPPPFLASSPLEDAVSTSPIGLSMESDKVGVVDTLGVVVGAGLLLGIIIIARWWILRHRTRARGMRPQGDKQGRHSVDSRQQPEVHTTPTAMPNVTINIDEQSTVYYI
jgi:hypothetical protein